MTNNKDGLYKKQGERLRKIRKELDFTKIDVSKESGFTKGSIHRYEKGLRFPCLDYLRFLHDKCKVNLNYIFGGEDRKFQQGVGDTPPDFGNLQELVNKMLRLMDSDARMCFAILAYAKILSEDKER